MSALKSIIYFWPDKFLFIAAEANRGMRYHDNMPNRILSFGLNGPIKIDTGEQLLEARIVLHEVNASWGESFTDDVVCNLLIDPASELNQILLSQMTRVNNHLLVNLPNENILIEHFRRIYHQSLSIQDVSEIFQASFGYRCLCTPDQPDRWQSSHIDKRIKHAVIILQGDLSRRLSTKTIAKRVGLSESRLFYLFKRDLGLSIRRYILWRRFFLMSKYGLQEKNLLRAALMVGFWDAAHMSNTFKSIIGAPPSKLLRAVLTSKFLTMVKRD